MQHFEWKLNTFVIEHNEDVRISFVIEHNEDVRISFVIVENMTKSWVHFGKGF